MKNIEKSFTTRENKDQARIQEEQRAIKPKEEGDFYNKGETEEFDEETETKKKEEKMALARNELEKAYGGQEVGLEVKSENIGQERTPQEIIEFRLNQSRESRLAEYITGLRPDDPKMPERLALDHNIVRTKYGLPGIDTRFNAPQGEYENFLKGLAKENKVEIRNKSACGKFFEENDLSSAYLKDNRVIGINMERNNPESYQTELATLEHEMIHSIQFDKSPRMPIEGAEYEAYVAAVNPEYFKQNPEAVGQVFDKGIKNSVDSWYSQVNEARKQRNMPELKQQWDDPEYFLKNVDKIDGKEIEKYKQQNESHGNPVEENAMGQARAEVETAFSQGDSPIETVGGTMGEAGGMAGSGPPIPSP